MSLSQACRPRGEQSYKLFAGADTVYLSPTSFDKIERLPCSNKRAANQFRNETFTEEIGESAAWLHGSSSLRQHLTTHSVAMMLNN